MGKRPPLVVTEKENRTIKKFLMVLALTAAITAHSANAWMQDARKSPKWFTDGVMYQIQPRVS